MPNFYSQVPKGLEENLAYRVALRKQAEQDPAFQRACIAACRSDVLYFFNAICWLYEPRPRRFKGKALPKTIPFITWAHQDPVILAIDRHLGFEDIGVEKSRGEGMSWIAILLGVRDWIFEPLTAIGFVSRNMEMADNPENPDSLMWKVDWELTKLPTWMVPKFKRSVTDHTLRNLDNGATITAYAATGDVASGGRKKWFLMDELAKFPFRESFEAMASTQYVTDSRLIVSTPKGTKGAYYQIMHEPSSMVKLILDWKDNPIRRRGLYVLKNNRPVAVEPETNPLLPEYNPPSQDVLDIWSRLRTRGFKLDGIRSPYYDHECDRPLATPQNIAQELDRDYGGSMFRVFGHEFYEKAEQGTCDPLLRGVMDFNKETLAPDFQETADGPVLLWSYLGSRGRPPERPYVVGADVAAGTGGSYSSNSVVTVIDAIMMEQVLEWATNTVDPGDFAEYCIAIAKWFWDAYLIWECNGPTGSPFSKRVLERRYGNIYYRTAMTKRGKVKSKEVGWYTSDSTSGTKGIMFSGIRRAVVSGGLKVRSRHAIRECGEYVWIDGQIKNVHEVNTDDESATGAAHGDRVIALGVAIQGVQDRPVVRNPVSAIELPYNCMARRDLEYQESLKAEADDWDDRDNADLIRPAYGSLLQPARR